MMIFYSTWQHYKKKQKTEKTEDSATDLSLRPL